MSLDKTFQTNILVEWSEMQTVRMHKKWMNLQTEGDYAWTSKTP